MAGVSEAEIAQVAADVERRQEGRGMRHTRARDPTIQSPAVMGERRNLGARVRLIGVALPPKTSCPMDSRGPRCARYRELFTRFPARTRPPRFARHRFRFRLPMLRLKSESRFALRSRNILLTRAMISSSVCSISGRSSGRSRSSCRTFPSMFAMKAWRAVKRAFVTLIRSSS